MCTVQLSYVRKEDMKTKYKIRLSWWIIKIRKHTNSVKRNTDTLNESQHCVNLFRLCFPYLKHFSVCSVWKPAEMLGRMIKMCST